MIKIVCAGLSMLFAWAAAAQSNGGAAGNRPGCQMPAADIVIKLNRMDPVAFSHLRHLAANPDKKSASPSGFSCSDCHPGIFERTAKGPIGMEVPHESGGCAQCHNGKARGDGKPTAFAATARCLTCHKPSTSSSGAARP